MHPPSTRWILFVLIALAAICANIAGAEHDHGGPSEGQSCWLCIASVGNVGIPAFVCLLIASILSVTSFVEINLTGLTSIDPSHLLSIRAPPPLTSM